MRSLIMTSVVGVFLGVVCPAQVVSEEKVPRGAFRDCPDCPEMVVIPPGSFLMGSDAAEQAWAVNQGAIPEDVLGEAPRHRVTISRSFAVGKYPVTQKEWGAIMRNNPSKFKGPQRPVDSVTWDDAKEFVRRLNVALKSPNGAEGPYRLLSEAEWEYAAKAGTTTKWHCGDLETCLSAVAVHRANSGGRTVRVGSKQPNAFGLFDMHGNVSQWVEDCWADTYLGTPSDGSAASDGVVVPGKMSCERIVRGGSWHSLPSSMRSAHRDRFIHDYIEMDLGFRVAKTLR
ncbi:formylglycine-generating enzyme family protein [Paramagnetospirillum kuznetsovii]|uniref:Formylglycine-generating enzyme family protein n=1 Tax=Paramagnetospirillum kuznetsovii TaxID=2053833 RepID=A0A364NTF7_9PROT|nr:formylglycine-generating enzyme family protein [Paramagnetospirillum kuznetsovii]RAU20300.1 formylglycine-generating enzyme family protein [Paramagnetospirillum kuznetsovii]